MPPKVFFLNFWGHFRIGASPLVLTLLSLTAKVIVIVLIVYKVLVNTIYTK